MIANVSCVTPFPPQSADIGAHDVSGKLLVRTGPFLAIARKAVQGAARKQKNAPAIGSARENGFPGRALAAGKERP